MTTEDEVRAAAMFFYEAIESLVLGVGMSKMNEAWHHLDSVSNSSPVDGWAKGWEEVHASFEAIVPFGRADRGGGKILTMEVFVYGEVAHTINSFEASTSWGGDVMLCSNILRCIGGRWKIVHHHVDPAPSMGAALEGMIAEA